MSITLSGKGIIVLPNPNLGDSEGQDVLVDSKRTMDGTHYTYVQTTDRKRYVLTFDHVDRENLINLEQFFIDNVGQQFTYIDSVDVEHLVVFENDTLSVDTTRRAAASGLRNEFGEVTITLVGT